MRKATTRHCITGGEVYAVGMEGFIDKARENAQLIEGWLVAINLMAFAVYGIDNHKSMYGKADAFGRYYGLRFFKRENLTV